MGKTIFITGASRGFGKVWTEAALKRGDNIIATVRNLSTIQDLSAEYPDTLLVIQVDVNDREAGIEAVKKGADHFGALDVLINNAGYGLFGAIEETTEEQARAQMETNFFGPLWITQAAIPIMRKQGSGHIIQVSSIGGIFAVPILGIYHASKFALEGFSESLANEVSSFGIKVTMVEPGGYTTDWRGASAAQTVAMPEYNGVKDYIIPILNQQNFDPEHTGQAILTLIDAEHPPLRVLFGSVWPLIKGVYEERIRTWEAWEDLSSSAS